MRRLDWQFLVRGHSSQSSMVLAALPLLVTLTKMPRGTAISEALLLPQMEQEVIILNHHAIMNSLNNVCI